MIDEHARAMVIPIEAQNDGYEPTPYEWDALKRTRQILTEFAIAILTYEP